MKPLKVSNTKISLNSSINKEEAQEVRRFLKEVMGYGPRQVSLKIDNYSMGQTIIFTVRDPKVDPTKLDNFPYFYEKIRRDDFGDILSGGNTYVEVKVIPKVIEAWGKIHAKDVGEAVRTLKEAVKENPDFAERVKIGRTGYELWNDPTHGYLTFRLYSRTEKVISIYAEQNEEDLINHLGATIHVHELGSDLYKEF